MIHNIKYEDREKIRAIFIWRGGGNYELDRGDQSNDKIIGQRVEIAFESRTQENAIFVTAMGNVTGKYY